MATIFAVEIICTGLWHYKGDLVSERFSGILGSLNPGGYILLYALLRCSMMIIVCSLMAHSVAAASNVEMNSNSEILRYIQSGENAYKSGQYDQARRVWKNALIDAQTRGDQGTSEKLLLHLVMVCERLRDFPAELSYAQLLRSRFRTTKNVDGEIACLITLSDTEMKLGRYTKMLETNEQLLRLGVVSKQQETVARALAGIGLANKALFRNIEALNALQRAEVLTRDTITHTTVLRNMGMIEAMMGRYDLALRHVQAALAIDQNAHFRVKQRYDWSDLASINRRINRTNESIYELLQALAIDRELHDTSFQETDLVTLGEVYINLDRLDEAQREQIAALHLTQINNNRHGEGAIILDLGNILYKRGRWAQALENFQRALVIAEDFNDLELESMALHDIGVAQNDLGHSDMAIAAIQKSSLLSQSLHRTSGVANNLVLEGEFERDRGHVVIAIRDYWQAYDMFLQLKERDSAGHALEHIGEMEASSGHLDSALQHFNDALTIFRQVKNLQGQRYCYIPLGDLSVDLGRYDDGLMFYQRALEIDIMLRNTHDKAEDEAKVGILFMSMKKLNEARLHMILAIKYAGKNNDYERVANYSAIMALVENELGYNTSALQTIFAAASIHRSMKLKYYEADDHNIIAMIDLKIGDLVSAKREIETALSLAQADNGLILHRSIYITAANIARKNGDYQQAIGYFEQLLSLAEGERAKLPIQKPAVMQSLDERAGLFSSDISVYEEYIGYLCDLDQQFPNAGYDRRAFAIFERKQARSNFEQMSVSRASALSGTIQNLLVQKQRLDTDLAVAHAELTQLYASDEHNDEKRFTVHMRMNFIEKQLLSLESELKLHFPAYYNLMHPQTIGVTDLQAQVLKSGETVLAYDNQDAYTILWVIDSKRFRMLKLPISPASQDEIMAKLKAEAVKLDDKAFVADSSALFRQMIPPEARALLADAKHLVIIPSGYLYALPFESLVTNNPSEQHPHYLIQDYAISYVPSASLLALIRATNHSSIHTHGVHTLLAFAPSYQGIHAESLRPAQVTGHPFTELPQSTHEVETVRIALGAPRESSLIGSAASKQALMALNASGELSQYSYLVFATHATSADPSLGRMEPALILADSQNGSSELGTSDILNLRLHANLVSLSACATLEVPHERGEGLRGITEAFLYAGAPAVTTTLWTVDDRAQALITERFYGLMGAGQTPSAALRQAKIELLKGTHTSPYYWASSVIFGDGNTQPY